ncbi:MAG: hypothetical protein ABJC63_00075 [Gemmatimonadales bacterium]
MLRKFAVKLKNALEYLGGVHDESNIPRLPSTSSYFWGFWWGLLILFIVAFSGQTLKFLYIDF